MNAVFDMQTLGTQSGNLDSAGVSTWADNPENPGATGFPLREPHSGASFAAYGDSGTTGLGCGEGAPVGPYPSTVSPQYYGDGEISQSVPMPLSKVEMVC